MATITAAAAIASLPTTALAAGVSLTAGPTPAAAVTTQTTVTSPNELLTAKFWMNRNYYDVNGKRNGMDSSPFVDAKAGRVLMPLRYLAYSLGIAEGDIQFTKNASGWVDQVIIRRPSAGGFKDTLQITVDSPNILVNGGQTGALDVAPRIVNNRLMVPYRAAAQALGAMVAWDAGEKAIIVKTWKAVPAPQKPLVQKVSLLQGQRQMKSLDINGVEKTLQAASVPLVVDPVDHRTRFDILEYLKAWGIPDSAILYDPVQGSLAVRGIARENKPGEPYGAGFVYFYAGDGYGWISNYLPTNPEDGVDAITLVNGRLYGSVPLLNAVSPLFGRRTEGGMTNDAMWVRLVNP
ncbi:hypothetical protein GTO91_03745 [Heliobacterium undosum]|uniref:Copper amine oxidase-like N-terminal domain-containing protein n=1 Tax=Heliomicrobium undosum TaxID=121734 RepID=A0A845L7C4_9FIRM|nr:stalk domain-containing protein [Heliomicrobium undosum]MZP28821.1 hypothetical protein [Heliomicrobium undosum]